MTGKICNDIERDKHSIVLEKSTRELGPNAMIRRSVVCGPKREVRH